MREADLKLPTLCKVQLGEIERSTAGHLQYVAAAHTAGDDVGVIDGVRVPNSDHVEGGSAKVCRDRAGAELQEVGVSGRSEGDAPAIRGDGTARTIDRYCAAGDMDIGTGSKVDGRIAARD